MALLMVKKTVSHIRQVKILDQRYRFNQEFDLGKIKYINLIIYIYKYMHMIN